MIDCHSYCSIWVKSKPHCPNRMSCAWFHSLENVPLKDGITDTLSQGHTHLQSLEECLDQRDTAPDTVCSKASLYTCASTYCLTYMCRAALCIKMHLGGYLYSPGNRSANTRQACQRFVNQHHPCIHSPTHQNVPALNHMAL